MPDGLCDDILDGVDDFSEFLGRDKFPPRRIHHLIDRGLLPAGRIGRRIIGSKTAVRKMLAALTGAEVA